MEKLLHDLWQHFDKNRVTDDSGYGGEGSQSDELRVLIARLDAMFAPERLSDPSYDLFASNAGKAAIAAIKNAA